MTTLLPGILSEEELASCIEDFETELQTTCAIYRQTVTNDGEGGRTYLGAGAYQLLETTVCHLAWSTHRPPNEFYQPTTGRVQSQAFYVCFVPKGTDVKAKDRILIDSQFYEVQAPITDRSYGMCERLQITAVNHVSP